MNFRELVAALDSNGELLRITKAVDSRFELPALLSQAEARGQAVRFERVKGAEFPVVGGVLTTMRRWAIGLGQDSNRFEAPNSLEQFMVDAVAQPVPAVHVAAGSVSEVVIDTADVDTTALPAPLFFSGDSHRFISAGLGFVIDPEHGGQNVGFYRVPIVDSRTISISAGPTSDMRRIYEWHRTHGTPLQVALVVGVAPALQIAAAADLPAGVSDIDVAGALQGSAIELVKCRTSDVMVPADAELVIEVTVDLDTWVDNTMGEFGDLYGKTSSPVATIDVITHRRDAQFHVIMAGMNREHNQLGRMLGYDLRHTILSALRDRFACVHDLRVDLTPQRTGMRAQVFVSINKALDEEPRAIIDAIFALQIGRFPMSLLLQRIVIVDTDVDILDHQDVDWAIASRMNRADQFQVFEDQTGRGAAVTRLGLDATAPLEMRSALRRPDIPDAAQYNLDAYLSD